MSQEKGLCPLPGKTLEYLQRNALEAVLSLQTEEVSV